MTLEFDLGNTQRDQFLSHAITAHRMVIGDVGLISDLTAYVNYWKERFKSGHLAEFCAVIRTNSGPKDSDPSEFYFLICDNLPEDRKLREDLNNRRLEVILEYQGLASKVHNLQRGLKFLEILSDSVGLEISFKNQ